LRPIGGTVVSKNHRVTTSYEENQAPFLPKVLNGEKDNYFGRPISQAVSGPIQFNVTGLDTSVPRQVLKINLLASQGQLHQLKVVLNGHEIGHVGASTFPNREFSEELLVPTSFFVEGINTITLNETEQARTVFFDSVALRYSRKYVADQHSASFYTPGLRKVDVTGFSTSNIRLFDMTLDGSPVQISDLDMVEENGTFTLKLPSSRAMVMYAASDSAILTSPSVVANLPSTLHAATNSSDVVIISTTDLMPSAEAWAAYRRSAAGGGFTVTVANVVDILDEFSYGNHSGAGINSFLKYANTTWAVAPRYAC
jgi:hypothetical protein